MAKIFTRTLLGAVCAAMFAVAPAAGAQETIRVGMIAEMSGPFAEFGKQMEAGIKIYQQHHGESVAGKRVEIIYKDVAGPNPELSKRIAQELVVRDKVHVLAGFGFTPNALAVAPIATKAKVPMIVMNAAAAKLTEKSPYMVRTSYTYPDVVPPIADWAIKQGYKTAYVIVSDYAPGHDAEAAFIEAYKKAGGTVVANVRTPMMTVDFSPYMQRVKDAKPDVLFGFVNGGDIAPAFMREFRAKGLPEAGIKLIGSGEIVDETVMEVIGDNGLDTVTVYPYSMHHRSELNKRFVADFKALHGDKYRPTAMTVGAYDAMGVLYAALKKTGGATDGQKLVEAMKGVRLESPRGEISIDPQTRDVVQNKYIRRVKKIDGVLANDEFEIYKATH